MPLLLHLLPEMDDLLRQKARCEALILFCSCLVLSYSFEMITEFFRLLLSNRAANNRAEKTGDRYFSGWSRPPKLHPYWWSALVKNRSLKHRKNDWCHTLDRDVGGNRFYMIPYDRVGSRLFMHTVFTNALCMLILYDDVFDWLLRALGRELAETIVGCLFACTLMNSFKLGIIECFLQ